VKRRSTAGGKLVKTRRGKTVTLKRGNAPKAVRRRASSTTSQETKVGRLIRERDEALERQAATADENARLINELRESLEQTIVAADVLNLISRSTFDLPKVFQTLVESAARLCEADKGAILRPSGKEASYYVAASYHQNPQYAEYLKNLKFAPGRGSVVPRVLLEGKSVQISDVLADPEYTSRELASVGDFRTVLGVPLLRDGVPIGVLVLHRAAVRPFTEKQIKLVETFADQAVIAIENTRLLSELRQRTDDLTVSLDQQTATSEVLQVISSSPGELEPVFRAMLENAMRLCEAEFGNLFLYDGQAFRTVALYRASQAYTEARQRPFLARDLHPQVPLVRIIQSKGVIHIADVRTEQSYIAGDPEFSKLVDVAGARTLLLVPLLRETQFVGAFAIYRKEVRKFADKQIELVGNFAAQAVIAIENTRLLNELRQRTDDLSESLEQQTATSEVLRVISSSPGDLQPVFEAMLANATRLCQANYGNMLLWEGGAFRMAALHGDVPAIVREAWQPGNVFRPRPDVPIARMAQTRKAVQVTDLREDRGYASGDPLPVLAVDVAGVRSLIAIPMLKDNELVGAVFIYRKEVRPFTDKQIELVTNFAAQAVIAIENVRLLNELRESLQQQTATADVLSVISRSAFDLQPVFETVAESSVRLCGADRAFIFRFDGELLRMVAAYNASQDFKRWVEQHPIRPGRHSGSARAALERRTIHIPDVLADPEYSYGAKDVEAIRTVLGVPILKGNDLLGVMMIYHLEVRPFTDKQIALVETFADQAAIAIENVRLFESVEAHTRELAKSLDDLRTAQDRLVQTEKLASLGQLTAGIAHEIKNPLNFVNNFSAVSVELIDELRETLGGVHLDSKLRTDINEIADMLQGNLDKVVQHGKRADSIVKNMLLHSRQGSGEHRPVDINALVDESLNLAYHGARAEKQGFNITLKRSFDPAAGEVDLFPQEITRVLLNLISNGFYAANKRNAEANGGDYEPRLAAATKNLGDSVEISIRDNGTGIPSEVKEKLFNPFFTTKPAGEGTGLGLSISHDIIVKQHGGSIEVDTQPGEFTEFRIVLPRKIATLAKSGDRQ
jgi:two-component system NtrC family sensor kinase